MREILFRAKRIDNGEWVYWNIFGELCRKSGKGTRLEIQNGATISYYDYIHQIRQFISADTICRCTGLTDKNGKKIWENDIVKRYNANGEEWRISKIVWADHSLNMGWCIEDVKSLTEYSNRLFKVGFDVNDTEKCEVIGNTFDNVDLLKGE